MTINNGLIKTVTVHSNKLFDSDGNLLPAEEMYEQLGEFIYTSEHSPNFVLKAFLGGGFGEYFTTETWDGMGWNCFGVSKDVDKVDRICQAVHDLYVLWVVENEIDSPETFYRFIGNICGVFKDNYSDPGQTWYSWSYPGKDVVNHTWNPEPVEV